LKIPKNNMLVVLIVLSVTLFSRSAVAACTAAQTPPPGSAGFNLNEAIKEAEEVRISIDSVSPAIWMQAQTIMASPVAIKTQWIVTKFWPGAEYDLKNRTYNPTSQEYGNFAFGAIGRAMGLSETDLLRGAAAVQQYQNYSNPNHPNHGSMSTLVKNILSGAPDNPDDPAVISGGVDYYDNVYSNDANASSYNDSCNQNGANNQTPNPYSGSGIGFWNGSGGFLGGGIGGCIGRCPTGVVYIEDIEPPPVPDQE